MLLANDNLSAANVTVDFLLEGGGVVSRPVNVPAKSRHTMYAGDVAELVNRSFGISINASHPIIAERAMYLPGPHLLEGGHESAGVNAPSTKWFLAEGATGSFFNCFVLLSNPNGSAANVTLTYLLPGGSTVQQPLVMPANSRSTINVATVDPQLADTAVSTTITSDIGIVAERAMYWPDISVGWDRSAQQLRRDGNGAALGRRRWEGWRGARASDLHRNARPHVVLSRGFHHECLSG